MQKKIETFTVTLKRGADYGVAIINKPGRAPPLYEATRDTCERALLAALNGAGISWVPGTHTATIRNKRGELRKINLEFSAI